MPFEQTRDHVWAWAKTKLDAAQPFIADYERLMASKATDEDAHIALCKKFNLRTAIERIAHRQGVVSLSEAFGVEDVNWLAQGGFERPHSFFLMLWGKAVEKGHAQHLMGGPFDSLYAEHAGA